MSTLQWAVGTFSSVIGAQMLIVPHQFSAQTYDALRPNLGLLGTVALLVGLALLLVGALRPASWLAVAAHLGASLTLLFLAIGLAQTGGWFGATIYAVLAVGMMVAAGVTRVTRASTRHAGEAIAPTPELLKADLFAILIGVALALNGLASIAFPAWFRAPAFDAMSPGLLWLGPLLMLFGALVVVTQLNARANATLRWLCCLALVIVTIAPLLGQAIALRVWTGIALYGGTSAALLLLPWLGPRLERIDPGSLRTRLAVTFGLTAALALILVVVVDANREETSIRRQVLASQQSLAVSVSRDVVDYVQLHQAAVRALAASPGLVEAAPEHQHAWLEAYKAAYPDAAVLTLYAADGRQIARSDDLPSSQPIASEILFQMRQTKNLRLAVVLAQSIGRPVFAVLMPIVGPEGNLRGVAGAAVESSRLAEQLVRSTHATDERAYLVDSQGRTIAHPDASLVASFADLTSEPPVAELLGDTDDSDSLVYMRDREEWLAGVARVPGLGWGVVVERPASLALASVRIGREQAFLALLVIVAGAMVIGAIVAGWLTAPLAALSHVVRRLADAPATIRVETGGITEVAGLANAFSEMQERLAARTRERERSEAALRESEQRFRMMANSAPVLIWTSGPDGRTDFFNDGWLNFTGRPWQEQLGDGWVGSVHPDDLERCLSISRSAADTRRPFEREYRLRRADGEYRWIVDQAAPRVAPDGSFAGYVGSCIDITELRHSVEALTASEERLRFALEAGRMGTWDWNVQANTLAWAGSLEEIHGLVPGTFDGEFSTFANLIHPADRDRFGNAIQGALQTGGDFNEEFRVTWADGTVHWIAGLGHAFLDETGAPTRMVGIGLEVTDRRRAVEVQRLLADAGTQLVSSLDNETILRGIAELVVRTIADYCIIELRDEGEQRSLEVAHADPTRAARVRALLEYIGSTDSTADARSTIWTEQPLLVPRTTASAGGVAPAHPAAVGVPALLADALGTQIGPYSLICVPLLARGRTIGTLAMIAAESGRQYGPDDLGLAEALATRAALAVDNARLYGEAQAAVTARDEFLSIASHELRTPVTSIKGYAQLLRRAQDRGRLDPARLARSLVSIEEAAERLATLTQDLLDVSRIRLGQLPLRAQEIDLVDLVERGVQRLREQLTKGYELIPDLPATPSVVQADPGRLEQVLTNLLDNAVKYSPDGSQIWVTLRRDTDRFLLTVRDKGIGLPDGAAETIFRPFGRAANASEHNLPGMGLGLYICRSIIERHGGRISASSEGEGQGTTLTVELPVQGAFLPAPEHARP
jgi:PAS domain S-box-containing protein